MRAQFPQSLDFNQMLVFSVFGHLLLLTFVLFIPKPSSLPETVVPAFMVNLVSEPAGYKPAAPKPKPKPKPLEPKVIKKPVEKKIAPKKMEKINQPAKPTAVKQLPVTKTIEPNKALKALNLLEESSVLVAPNLVEDLDQLARLERPKVKPKVSKPIKRKPIAEKTFRDLETLRNKKIIEKKALAPVPLHEDILENFEELKIKESLPEIADPLEKQEAVDTAISEKVKPKIPARDLLKELEQIAKLDASPVLVPDVKKGSPELKEETKRSNKSYDPIIEKLGSFSVDSEPIKVEVFSTQLDSSSFQSKLRTLPKPSPSKVDSGKGDSHVLTTKEGPAGADAQSLYVGLIQDKVFKNWREPLAEKHNLEAVVSFFIFRGGNIDKPLIKQSSGVEDLDTLAVRAVLDSVPFPEFPEGLKKSNLHISIYFKYVPKDE
jgi:outer membrane biosynthesis protein TonB